MAGDEKVRHGIIKRAARRGIVLARKAHKRGNPV
jgi:hypothetical protein